MHGILNIYKEPGPTSHDIVDKIRKITKIKKVGHAGTLDPFAEGILIILIGKSTKSQSKFMNMDKEYIATIKLGKISDTYDKTGKLKMENVKCKITIKNLKNILKTFVGEIKQIPPAYSAIKIKGKKAYQLSRRNKKPELKPRKIKIYNIKLLKYKWPILKIKVKCGKGTYIRSLAHDVGQKLGCGAYLEKLIRTEINGFNIKKSTKIEKLNHKNWTKKLLSDNI